MTMRVADPPRPAAPPSVRPHQSPTASRARASRGILDPRGDLYDLLDDHPPVRRVLSRGELESAALLAGAALAMMDFSHLTWMPEMYVAERIVDRLSSERPELAALAREAAKRPFYDIAREELELMRAGRSPTMA